MRVIVAPDTTAPLESVTVPVISPVAICAGIGLAMRIAIIATVMTKKSSENLLKAPPRGPALAPTGAAVYRTMSDGVKARLDFNKGEILPMDLNARFNSEFAQIGRRRDGELECIYTQRGAVIGQSPTLFDTMSTAKRAAVLQSLAV